MAASLASELELLDGVFSRSKVLSGLGYATHTRDVVGETGQLPATCHFTLLPSGNRKLVVSFCYASGGDHFFTVELFRSDPPDSFLLDEWMKLVGAPRSPYPFILASYPGDILGKMQGLVEFLETQLSNSAIKKVLDGSDWLDIPFDWGNLK